MSLEFLWYIPNQVQPGHRGDDVVVGHNSLDTLTVQTKALEDNGWGGALLGTGWGRPDTFTVATALAARTTMFRPLIAVRPGYWQPAHFASAAANLDHLTGGRTLIHIVSGQDNLAAHGDSEAVLGGRRRGGAAVGGAGAVPSGGRADAHHRRARDGRDGRDGRGGRRGERVDTNGGVGSHENAA